MKNRIFNTPTKYLHTIEIKSSKIVISLVGLSFFLLLLLFKSLYQWNENIQLSDNDIKYCYIKIRQGIDNKNLYALETIFEYELDKAKQESLRQSVETYERKVRERAEELEHARLKEEKANQLLEETEKLRGEK